MHRPSLPPPLRFLSDGAPPLCTTLLQCTWTLHCTAVPRTAQYASFAVQVRSIVQGGLGAFQKLYSEPLEELRGVVEARGGGQPRHLHQVRLVAWGRHHCCIPFQLMPSRLHPRLSNMICAVSCRYCCELCCGPLGMSQF